MTALLQPDLLTEEEYLETEEFAETKHEYLGGQVHAMAGANNQHNTIAMNFLGLLHAQLRSKPCKPFNSDTKVRIPFRDHIRFYYPDAMIVCESSDPLLHYQENPVVILEVLSESTRRTDLNEKTEAYLSLPSLRVLLLAESDSQTVIIHRRDSAGLFQSGILRPPATEIPLPEIEASLRLFDLYEGTNLPAAISSESPRG
jgi:Uma2 family endonuclease